MTDRDETLRLLAPAIDAMCDAFEAWCAATPNLQEVHADWFIGERVTDFRRTTKRFRGYAERHFPDRVTWKAQ